MVEGLRMMFGGDTVYSVHTVHSYVLIERRGVSGFGIAITSEQWKKPWLLRLYRGLYYPIYPVIWGL